MDFPTEEEDEEEQLDRAATGTPVEDELYRSDEDEELGEYRESPNGGGAEEFRESSNGGGVEEFRESPNGGDEFPDSPNDGELQESASGGGGEESRESPNGGGDEFHESVSGGGDEFRESGEEISQSIEPRKSLLFLLLYSRSLLIDLQFYDSGLTSNTDIHDSLDYEPESPAAPSARSHEEEIFDEEAEEGEMPDSDEEVKEKLQAKTLKKRERATDEEPEEGELVEEGEVGDDAETETETARALSQV